VCADLRVNNPLETLSLAGKNGKPIAYEIMLTGASSIKTATFGGITVSNVPRSLSTKEGDYQILNYPTYFGGKYQLIDQ